MKSKNVYNLRAILAPHFSSTGLLVQENATDQRCLLGFLDAVLRGIGQVMLQNNSYAGVLFLAGIFYNSTLFGWAALLGATISTATAMLLGVSRARIGAGLFGFNGALVAIALLYFLEPTIVTGAYVVLAAACSTIVMAALLNLFESRKIPVLTAPFVFTTLFFVMACARLGRLHSTGNLPTAGLPKTAIIEGVVSASTFAEGLFNGIAQVFFQGNVVTGILFAIGLLISSRVACAAALIGSLTGLIVAWGMGAAEPAIRSGAFGFNSVLTAIAMMSVFYVLNVSSALYGLLAMITTAVMFAAVSAALEPLGMPALTAPFVIVVWIFVLAGPLFPKLQTA
ncbi:urea transporter [Herminiimonas sp. NPDC097707]|uniref:urea transporter n=1 Tax=Herminiimonas sp. NPDC097707 TaxID=3364007 RepID=UPI00383BE1E0